MLVESPSELKSLVNGNVDGRFVIEDPYDLYISPQQNSHYRRNNIADANPYSDGIVRVPGSAIHVYHDVVCDVSHGITIKNGELIEHSYPEPTSPLISNANKTSDIQVINEPMACFYRPDAVNYFHWLVQIAPSLAELSEFAPEIPAVIPNKKLREYQITPLKLLGLDSNLVTVEDKRIKCKTLIRSSTSLYNRPNAVVNRATFRFAQRIQDACRVRLRRQKRLYISRKDTAKRAMASEPEAETLFRSLGFEIVVPSELSFVEQVELFSQASCIAGTHGAGMTNLLFAPRGIKLLELIPTSWTANMFFSMSQQLSMNYHRVYGKPTEADSVPAIDRCWDLDMEHLTKVAHRFISKN